MSLTTSFTRHHENFVLECAISQGTESYDFMLTKKTDSEPRRSYDVTTPWSPTTQKINNAFAEYVFKNSPGQSFDVTIRGYPIIDIDVDKVMFRETQSSPPIIFNPSDFSLTQEGRTIEFHPRNALYSLAGNREKIGELFCALRGIGNPEGVIQHLVFSAGDQLNDPDNFLVADNYVVCKPAPEYCRECIFREMVFMCQTQGYFGITEVVAMAS